MTLDTSKPLGSEAPSSIDDYMRADKAAWQARLNVDHVFSLTGSLIDEVAAGGGKHRQVTMAELAADPTPVADDGVVYTKDVAAATELFFIGHGGTAVQLTAAGLLAVTKLNVDPVIDGVSLDWNGSDLLEVQVDDDTIELDPTNALQFKQPTVTADATSAFIPSISFGRYQGNGIAGVRTIDTGVSAALILIHREYTGGTSYPPVFVTEQGYTVSGPGVDKTTLAYLSGANGNLLTLATTDALLNAAATWYDWIAIGGKYA